MKVKSLLFKILMVFATISFLLIIAMTSILIPASSQNFYKTQFEKHNTLQKVHDEAYTVHDTDAWLYVKYLEEDELIELFNGVVDFCIGKTQTPNPTVDGEVLEVFTESEVSHLKDVRKLFVGFFIASGIALVFVILGVILAIVKKGFYYEKARRYPIFTLIAFGVLVGILGVACIVNFHKTFYLLHFIFFEGNFVFDHGIMIMLIGDIFAPLATVIIPVFLSLTALFTLTVVVYNRRLRKRFATNGVAKVDQE